MKKRLYILAGILAVSLFSTAAPVSGQAPLGQFPQGPGAVARDDFTGTGPVSGAWTTIRAGLTRFNGMLVEKSSLGIIRRNDIAPGAAQYSEGVWGVNAANIYNGQLHLFVRLVDADNYYGRILMTEGIAYPSSAVWPDRTSRFFQRTCL